MRTLFLSNRGCAVVLAAVLAAASLCRLWAPTPTEASSRAKRRGAELFAQSGCVHCHGPAGVGGGRGPDLQTVRKRMTRQRMFLQIQNGGMMMPSFGRALTTPQINDLIAYLRARRKLIPVPPRVQQVGALSAIATGPAAK